MLEQGTVVTLVDEKSRLLPPEPVDIEFQPVFDSDIGLELTYNIIVDGVETGLERKGCL